MSLKHPVVEDACLRVKHQSHQGYDDDPFDIYVWLFLPK